MTKAISAVIATIMLLMITVSSVGVFYVFSSSLASSTTSTGGQQISAETSAMTGFMRIDNMNGLAVDVRNMGTLDLSGISIFIDDNKAIISNITVDGNPTNIIPIGKTGAITVNFTNMPIKDIMNLKVMSQNAPTITALIKPMTNLVNNSKFEEGSWGTAGDCSCGSCSCAGGSCTNFPEGGGCGSYAIPPAGGCSALFTAFTAGGYNGGKSLNLTGINAAACNAKSMNNFQSGKVYTFGFKYKHVRGIGGNYCMWVGGCNTCNPSTPAGTFTSAGWTSYTITFRPEPCTTWLTPFFYAGPDAQMSENLYDDIYLIEGFKLTG